MTSRILVVDDEENICFAFEMILGDQGYVVETARDFKTALARLDAAPPDLVISDILLGGKTGMDLLAEVRARELNCPVIMITGQPNVETSAEAVRLGAFDYIPKPIRKEPLLRMARNGLAHKRLLDRKQALEAENLKVRRHMEAVFDSLQDGVITVDSRMNLVQANPAAQKICNLAAPEIPGRTFEGEAFQDLPGTCGRACAGLLRSTLETGESVTGVQVECMDNGRQTVRLTATPLAPAGKERPGAVLVVRNVTRLAALEKELNRRAQFHGIVGQSSRMQAVYTLLEDLSDTDTTVLITGETGTGKELVAHALHHSSLRARGPFIRVNCSALSESLLESELFGHVAGAFTGAVRDKKGRFEAADQGTLFLDEIADISPLVQVKLLRVLQEREFERVGDSTPIKTDVRIIAAANRDLREKVAAGTFREDLYYRIKVVDIPLPPLRERREDIPLLADHFMARFNRRFKKRLKGFSHEVTAVFMAYAWPGNIRELEHAVEHGFVLCKQDVMDLAHLPVEIRENRSITAAGPARPAGTTREDIIRALEKSGWNKSRAARLLGMGRRTIYRKIEQFNIVNPPD